MTVAAKQHYRTGAALPFVVRCPSGGGFSGGPFHSQNPECSFAHFPGLKLVCPATPEDAKGLLIEAIRDPNPVLYFEHKHLYRRIKGEVPDTEYTTPFGKARVHRAGSDLTIVTWGAMVYTADDAATAVASKDGTSVEVLDLRTIIPWDRAGGARRRSRAPASCSCCTRTPARQVSAPRSRQRLARRASTCSTRRSALAAPDTPVPFSPPLEKAFIPQVDDVVQAIERLAAY